MAPAVKPPVGVNGPTIFTGGGRLQLIARGLPFGPGGGVLRGIKCDVAQGGPMCGSAS